MKAKRTGDARRSDLKFKMLCCAEDALPIVLFVFIFLTVFTDITAGQAIPADRIMPIPIAEVAARAMEASDLLRSLNTQLTPSDEFKKIQNDLPALSSRMAAELQGTMQVLQTKPTLERLRTERELWENKKTDMGKRLSIISRRENKLQAALSQMGDLRRRWNQTLDIARAAQAQETGFQQINDVILSIEKEEKFFLTEQTATIDLQGQVVGKAAQCDAILEKIAQVQRAALSEFVVRERHAISNPELWTRVRTDRFAKLGEITAKPKADIEWYMFDPSSPKLIHFGIFVFLSGLFFMMRSKINRWSADEGSPFFSSVFDRPYAASLIVTLMVASSPYFSASPTVKNLFEVLALASMIRLMKPVIDQKLIFVCYSWALLFTLDMVRHALVGAILFDQIMIVAEAFSGLVVLSWPLVYGNLRSSFMQESGVTLLRVIRSGAFIVLVLFAVGLVAGALGYLLVAHLFVSGVIIGGALALALLTSAKIIIGMAAFGFRVRPLRLLRMVRRHRNLLEHRFYRILIWIAIVGWLVRVLDYVGLLQPALLISKAVLTAKLERGSISVSLEDLLAFVLCMWISYLLSKIINFVLNEDVYARIKVPHGIAYATTRLLHYLIMTVGFVLGMGLIGIDLTKVTVLIGAFGVGIGFGLQSVINNFVSGLILLFERPIHVDDTVEVANIQGTVKRIGIRASILRTRQGAEIIIPNSQLVSEQVTNWTLSDQYRRIDLPVGVNYSSAPRKVIEVLTAVASAHPRILKNPLPQVLLMGFGDSSINFELRAWTDEFNDFPKIRSELGVDVYDAIHAAGMSFPFPQREIRLIQDKEE